eukprot:1177723-Prorocentrum_minimum.AAC.4
MPIGLVCEEKHGASGRFLLRFRAYPKRTENEGASSVARDDLRGTQERQRRGRGEGPDRAWRGWRGG